MWWNEAYLDLSLLPGMDDGGSSPAIGGDASGEVPPSERYADIAGAATRVDAAIARLVAGQHPGRGPRRRDYERFLRDRPDVRRYGAFRAAAGIAGTDTATWPASWASGDIRPGRDVPEAAAEVHICAQWLTDSQVAQAAARAASAGCRLMPDLPIGCRPDGYDPWAFPSSYADAALSRSRGRTSVGAPPDRFFCSGQNWGFRPLHPEGERRAGYPVVLGSLRHLLRHAGALRIDHILGFQRLWWIPPGATPAEGTYVAYPGEELAALACLESWRHDAALIGEDLGTVDPGVRRLMRRHGICGMSVAVFELGGGGRLLRPRPGSCALVDTHDTATFAGWLDGDDIGALGRQGALGAGETASALGRRSGARRRLAARLGVAPSDARVVHAALLEELGASDAAVVIANLEDLWGERDPQNVPGTTSEHHNFARRLAQSLSALESDPEVLGPLRALDAARGARCAGPVEGTPASPGRREAVELHACDAPATGTMGR